MATILYTRVSTAEQTVEHQVTQARAAGLVFDQVVTDDGVSGVTIKLADREGGRRLFDLLRSGDTLVVRWVDRLGRNYEDVSDNIRAFMRRGVVIKTIINGMTFDGAAADPMTQAVRDALIGFMAALSQAQAEATKEAQKAGIAHAKERGEKVYLGRKPSFAENQINQVVTLRGEGKGVTEVAKQLGLSRATVYRILKSPSDAHASAMAWR
ncbi:recombinase family protein [Rhodoferax ferrireducens]|uniref:recombinase family protein n=1 Tax=Rhodoferax ferrireducens TaxID=192843 RepID=UPI003BB75666